MLFSVFEIGTKWLDYPSHFFSQVTAVHPVGDGQCIALGYESVLPLVLLTLQGGEVKPYEFPTEGTTAMAGTGAKCNDSSSTFGVIVFDFQFQRHFFVYLCIVLSLANVCFAGFLRRADSVWRRPKYLWRWRQIRRKKEKTSVKKQQEE